MLDKEPADRSAKKPYVKPQLATHGSVQKLTEKTHPGMPSHDSGSNVRFPIFGENQHTDW